LQLFHFSRKSGGVSMKPVSAAGAAYAWKWMCTGPDARLCDMERKLGVDCIRRRVTVAGIAAMDGCGAISAGMEKKVRYLAGQVYGKPAGCRLA
jgi:hypothetical protein